MSDSDSLAGWRASSKSAEEVFSTLIPDQDARDKYIQLVIDVIRAAGVINPNSWTVTIDPDSFRLLVSRNYVVNLWGYTRVSYVYSEEFRSSVDRGLGAIGKSHDVNQEQWKNVDDGHAITMSVRELLDQRELLQPTIEEFARQSAKAVRTRAHFWKYHSPGVIDYFNERYGAELSQPGYWRAPTSTGSDQLSSETDDGGNSFRPTRRTTRYWKIAPGANAVLWPQFRDRSLIAVQWAEVPDLRTLPASSRADFKDRLKNLSSLADAQAIKLANTTKQLWAFGSEMQVGDRVLAYGKGHVQGWGEISSDYIHREGDLTFPHQRSVRWISTSPISAATLPSLVAAKLRLLTTIVELTEDEYLLATNQQLDSGDEYPEPIDLDRTPFQELAKSTNLLESDLNDLIDLLRDRKQIILEGPPGSGKTWVADRLARYLTGNLFDGDPNEQVELVQFHQSYGYEDFVQGIRPVTVDGALQYRVVPGVFTRLCRTAEANPDKTFVLIIDEINRGNLSRIFGELLMLLEYRERRIRLPFGSDPDKGETDDFLRIPANLLIIGTMNSTDRSLAQIDYALRRRFYFHRLMPVSGDEAPVLRRWLDGRDDIDPDRRARIHALFVGLNRTIERHLTEDFQVGHSYFMRDTIGTDAGLRRVWERAVRPLLAEYFHGSHGGQEAMRDLDFTTLWAAAGQRAASEVALPSNSSITEAGDVSTDSEDHEQVDVSPGDGTDDQ